LVGGIVAHRLRQPLVLGYLVVGVVIGPHALGLVKDVVLVENAAAVGVALLMFTLGLEISLGQLKQVGKVGLWGGIAQVTITFAAGLVIGIAVLGWSGSQAVLFGLIISLSSTTVCLKTLRDRAELNSVYGRIMVAILILQDISVVVMMVVLPLMGNGAENLALDLGKALGKAILFVGAAIVSGLWLVPWLAEKTGGLRSRELFLLLVMLLCLGAAAATHLFGLSIAFGTFLIGLVVRESRFGHRALTEVGPLRDVFATLFFVSLGMLLDPDFLRADWPTIIGMVATIMFLKALIVFSILRSFGHSSRVALLAGVGLFQIGEFGFILAQGGIDMGLITQRFYSFMLASTVITMLLTPMSMSLIPWAHRKLVSAPRVAVPMKMKELSPLPGYRAPQTPRRVVIAGYGRIGQNIAERLEDAGVPFMVIDDDPARISQARSRGCPRIYGDARHAHVLVQAGADKAGTLVVTFADSLALVSTVEAALHVNPNLEIMARVERAGDAKALRELGVMQLVNPEHEASLEFVRRILIKSADEKVAASMALPSQYRSRKSPGRG